MKEIVCAIYHNCNEEARSLEMLKCCSLLGHVHYISYAAPNNIKNIECHLVKKSKRSDLFGFLIKSRQMIKKVKPDIVFLHDNNCAPLIPFIKRILPSTKIIYDSSELYIKEKRNKSRIIGSKEEGVISWAKKIIKHHRKVFEKKYLKFVDLIIAANVERAQIMKSYFNLAKNPIVFDNVHRIDDEYDQTKCDEKYSRIICKEKFNIIFAGGIRERRLTFDFINSFFRLGSEYNLIIAGIASYAAQKKYNQLVSRYDSDRVHYVGFISRAELRYLLQHCQASVVTFDSSSQNNIYCASGKCFESLFEGTPIIASENPPLKQLCDEHLVGVSGNDFAEAIKTISNNYDEYKLHVHDYINELHFENRIVDLKKQIAKLL